MRRLHIVGRKNHGKTTLVVDLVQELTKAGLRVGTIKHTHHRHELDTPGKDSHDHRLAGAAVVGVLSRSMSAIYWPVESDLLSEEDRYAAFSPMFAHCDLTLVEGDSQAKAPKIEVWRAERGTPPIAWEDRSILAVVTDDPLETTARTLPRCDVPRVARWIREGIFPTPPTQ